MNNLKFVKEEKDCKCQWCDPYWGENGSAIEMLGVYSDLTKGDPHYQFRLSEEGGIEFPYITGTVISEEELSKIQIWEEKSRSKGKIICCYTYFMIAVMKIHIGYTMEVVHEDEGALHGQKL